MEVSGKAGDVEVGVPEVAEVAGGTVTSTTLVVVVAGGVSTEVTVAGGADSVTVTGTAETVLVGGGSGISAVRGAGRPATSMAATSNPVAKPARPVTAAEPQVGRPLIRAPPRHAQRRYED
jgi:hypothetical protein